MHKKSFVLTLLVLVLVLVVGTANAQNKLNDNDIANCRWKDGRDMTEKDCEFFRKLKASDEAQAAIQQTKRNARLEQLQQQETLQEQAKAERKAKESLRAQELKREYDAGQVEYWKSVEDAKKQQASDEAAQKSKCGKDYGTTRIGMTLDRYEECTSGLVFETETVSKDALVETYRSTFYYIHAKDGRIVAFTRRTN